MNRAERKAIASQMRKQRAAWPEVLTPLPESQWPPVRPQRPTRPLAVWRSRHYFAQLFSAPPLGDIDVSRLTICRVTIGADGHWEADITWDDLQRAKRQCGFGDTYAVEVYPRDEDTVHIANMRHLWLLSKPLGVGWLKGAER